MEVEEKQEWLMSFAFTFGGIFRQFLDDYDINWFMDKGIKMSEQIDRINKQNNDL